LRSDRLSGTGHGPGVSSRQCEDGSMVSMPMEDLWPFLDREEFLSNMIYPPVVQSEQDE
jgi:acetolactate synthase-1/2/3 large subunit